jgi:hypothetical protein
VTSVNSTTIPASATLLTTASTIAVANGGTGATTFTSGNALIGNGTGAVISTAVTTSGGNDSIVKTTSTGGITAGNGGVSTTGNLSAGRAGTTGQLTITSAATGTTVLKATDSNAGAVTQTLPSQTGTLVSTGMVSGNAQVSDIMLVSGVTTSGNNNALVKTGSTGGITAGAGGVTTTGAVTASGSGNIVQSGSGNIALTGSGQAQVYSSSTSATPLIIKPTGTIVYTCLSILSAGPGTTQIVLTTVANLYVGATITLSGFASGNNTAYTLTAVNSGLTSITFSSSGIGAFQSGSTVNFVGSSASTLIAVQDGIGTTLAGISPQGAISGSGANITALSGANITSSTIPTGSLSSLTGSGSNVVTDVSPAITYGSTTVTGITGTGTNFVTSTSPTISTSIVTSTTFTLGALATSLTIGSNTGTVTHNYSTGATTTGLTKTINFGTGVTTGTSAVTIGSASATSRVTIVNPLNAPDVQSGTTYTIPANNPTPNVVLTSATQVTLTLPTSVAGKEIRILCQGAGGVISASSNVYPKTSRTLGTAILTTAGSALIVGDGTNWQVML